MTLRTLSYVLLSILLVDSQSAFSQSRDRCGLGQILNGKQNPSGRRRATPPIETRTQKPPSFKPVVGESGQARSLKSRIDQLKKKNRSTISPVKSLDQAKAQIAELKRRRDGLKLKADHETQQTVLDAARHAKGFQDKWGQIAKDVLRGNQGSDLEWTPTYDTAARKLQDKDILDFKPSKAVDSKIAPPEKSAEGAGGDAKKKPSKVAVPSFKDLKDAFAEHKKPKSMPSRRWAWLQDRFYRDLANLQANIAAAQRTLGRRHAEQLQGVDQAIESAEQALDRLAAADQLSPDARRDLAWRIHQARLRELQELYDRLSLAAAAAGRELGTHPLIEMHPLAPSKTLNQIARAMDTASRPIAPSRGQFDEVNSDGLPDLYPSDASAPRPDSADPVIQNGELLRARIERNQRHLQRRNSDLTNVEETIRREDAREIRQLGALLYRIDQERGRADHPLDQARRRVRMKEKMQELAKSRDERVANRRDQIKGDIEVAQNHMAKAYDRLEKHAPAKAKD